MANLPAKLAIPPEDMTEFASMPHADQTAIQAGLDIVQRLQSGQGTKSAVVAEIQSMTGMSRPSIYRIAKRYNQDGWRGLLHKAKLCRVARQTPDAFPPGFIDFVWQLSCANQRAFAPAYRSLFHDHLNAGKIIPGYGTDWRGIFRTEREGFPVPDESPYRPYDYYPKGWSYRHLLRSLPSIYQHKAARIGTAAASEYLPSIPTTRVGLEFGQVYMMDDVFHDARVKLLNNRDAQIVVELGALELLTAHYCSYGMKPVVERVDGTREHLREAYTRYLVADIVCRHGYNSGGCTIIGEHGTAKLPKSLMASLDQWTRGAIKFEAGGIMNRPIARGLPLGLRRGNFRVKALIESHHSLKKNEMAVLPGQKGADPEHAPEDLESRHQEHRALIKAAASLIERNPDAALALRSPFPAYHAYKDAVNLLYERIATRRQHRIEGWEENHFVAEEWRPDESADWLPISILHDRSETEAAAIRTLISINPAGRHRYRRLSPGEAFAVAKARAEQAGTIVRQPIAAAAAILGPDLGDIQQVTRHAVLNVRDPEIPTRRYQVAAHIETPDGYQKALPRGGSYLVHINPFNPEQALISNLQGGFMGLAPVMRAGCKTDADAFTRNIKILSKVQASEIRGLAPVAHARLAERYERLTNNVEALTGRDAQEILDDHAGPSREDRRRIKSHADDIDDVLHIDDDTEAEPYSEYTKHEKRYAADLAEVL
jgi:hypothetical protein